MQRQVTFETAAIEIEIMISDDADRRLVGQLVPGAVATVVMLVGADDSLERFIATADELGRFTFDDVPTEPVRFAVLGPDGQPSVRTERIDL